VLLEYFGEAPEQHACGHCDNCDRGDGAPPIPEVDLSQPVPDLLRAAQVAHAATNRLEPGAQVRVRRHGIGEVVALHDDKADVRFADGQTRTFKQSYVKKA
jgi:ATP-dependent DNA helicase RecQ